ncbi:NUDIX hydrolase [uncultured Paludibacter sp.]|uniref:NUDIX hydrolase n=1 Tax=uncultured Paludibacter sp. TaxID=497635 RepID=A0A653A8Y9_9BACT|nr:NUDIX hydrolase [uncultured Paludibacter sp.]
MNFHNMFKYCPKCGSKHFVVNNVKSKQCEDCGFVFYLNPSAACAAFIKNEEGELLVCRRGKEPAKGTLDLPGGFIDYNETAEQAMAREIKEEINGDVIKTAYVFSLPNDYIYSGMNIPTMDMFFECKLRDYTHLKPADDVEECFFLPIREINPALFGLNSIKKAVEFFISGIENERKENFMA